MLHVHKQLGLCVQGVMLTLFCPTVTCSQVSHMPYQFRRCQGLQDL